MIVIDPGNVLVRSPCSLSDSELVFSTCFVSSALLFSMLEVSSCFGFDAGGGLS